MTSPNSNATDSTEHNVNSVEEKYDDLLASGDERVVSVYQTHLSSILRSGDLRPRDLPACDIQVLRQSLKPEKT